MRQPPRLGQIRITAWMLCAAFLALAEPTATAQTTPRLSKTPDSSTLYEQRIRPLLARRCYSCHSAQSKTPQGGLLLDSPAGWRRGGNSGAVLVPGNSETSLLIKAVRYQNANLKMPPSGKLPDAEIELLAEWVKQGADAPKDDSTGSKPAAPAASTHWAFQPIKRIAPPILTQTTQTDTGRTGRHPENNPNRKSKIENRKSLSSWCFTPIDRFILAKLQSKGMTPSPPADSRTLIRRVTYDLIGLPPAPAEIEAFAKDRSPDAYEKVVDRLLASPRYGERWGRHWLDVAHYGDTHGYDKDKRRDHAWPYRDYVIRAFNSDKPYSRFIQEQIAGDVLFPNDPDGTIATGFIAAGPWDFVGQVELAEGTVEKQKTRLLDRDDMVTNVMSTFCSVTVHCARCHNHKFDPIPQKEYYRLQAVFAGIDRGDRPIADRNRREQQAALEKQQQDLTLRMKALQKQADAVSSPELTRMDTTLAGLQSRLKALPAPVQGADSPSNGYHSAIESRPDVEKWVQVDLGRSAAIETLRLIPARPTDFADTPGFGFPVRFRVSLSDDAAFANAVTVANYTRADFPNPGDNPLVLRLSGKRARYVRLTATRLWLRTNDYVFALAELQVESAGKNTARTSSVTALDSIEAGRWSVKFLTDDFDSRHPLPDLSDPAAAERIRLRSELLAQLQQTQQARKLLADSLVDAAIRAALEQTARELAAAEQQIKALPPPDLVFAALSHAPRPISVLARGEVEQPLEQVTPGALSCLPGLDGDFKQGEGVEEGRGRAALAAWITDSKNPLTWRSIVNRVWHYHFGRGLVDTPNDFGRNGSLPSHPELLDWLAQTFKAEPSFKKLHRLIVLSAVYRQSSNNNPAYAKRDGDNRLLWRMNRQRMDAEQIRDSVLAVSGKLDLKMGGPGFELFRFKDDHSPIYDHSAPEKINAPEGWRRAVYAFAVRSVQNPFLECLDCADPSINTPVRNTTLTALQALALLNDPFIVHQAEYFAERLKQESGDLNRQIETAYLLAFGRRPAAEERAALAAYALQNGLPNACRLLFNANEFVFID